MTIEVGVIVTVVIFAAGVLIAVGRTLERQATLARDLARLDKRLSSGLDEVKRVLYTTVGGRRAIRPIEGDPEPISNGEE